MLAIRANIDQIEKHAPICIAWGLYQYWTQSDKSANPCCRNFNIGKKLEKLSEYSTTQIKPRLSSVCITTSTDCIASRHVSFYSDLFDSDQQNSKC